MPGRAGRLGEKGAIICQMCGFYIYAGKTYKDLEPTLATYNTRKMTVQRQREKNTFGRN